MSTENENKQKQTNGYPTKDRIQELIRGENWKEIESYIGDKKYSLFGNSELLDEERAFYRTLMLELINSENIPKENLPGELKQVISWLLTEKRRKAFLNFTDASGNNLLHLCILKNKKEILSLLLEKIKDNDFVELLFKKNNDRLTPVELADDNLSLQQLIRESIRKCNYLKYFEEAIFTVVEDGNPKITNLLLDASVNPHRCNGKGQGLLDLAEEKGYTEIADLLRKKEVKNATFTHVFWEGFKSGVTSPQGIIMAFMVFNFAFAFATAGAGLPIGIAGCVVAGILSLVTAPIVGIINGARMIFNKKMHENQKRQRVSTTDPNFWHSLPQEYQPSAPPLHVGKLSDNFAFLVDEVRPDEEQQPSFITYSDVGCNTRSIASITKNESRFPFWSKSSDGIAPSAYQPSVPPAEESSSMNNGLC